MDLNLLAVILYFGLNIVSILACLRFLCAFSTFTKKTLALSMITVLSAIDLFYHAFALLLVLLPQDAVDPVRDLIINFSLRFMAFCSASIGLVIYKSMTNTTVENSEKFYKWNLVSLFVISAIFASLSEFVKIEGKWNQFYFSTIPMLVCFGITIFFFARSLIAIRILPKEIQRGMRSTIINLFCYPFAQLILLSPSLIISSLGAVKNIDIDDAIVIFILSPLALLGLGNTLIFLIQQKGTQNLAQSTDKLGEINATLSSIEQTEQSTFYHHHA